MNAMDWFNYNFQNKETENYIGEKINLFLGTYFRGETDYKKEKFIKVFAEGLLDKESTLYYGRGIHQKQLSSDVSQVQNLMVGPGKEKYERDLEEIVQIMRTETDRLARFFTIILE